MEKIVCLFAIALCGASAATTGLDAANRIANGYPASESQFLYAVSLQQISQVQTLTRGHKCGGALITLQYVLTAATCTRTNGVILNPSELRVFAGAVHLTNDNVPDRIRLVANITAHPQYVGYPSYLNDIAVIGLVTPFAASVVRPLQVPGANASPADNAPCIIAGWGSQNTTSSASIDLRYSNRVVMNQAACVTLSTIQPGFLTVNPSMMCALDIGPSVSCAGDIGNPLVCNNVLAGVFISNVNGCSTSGLPEVYVRVPSYNAWIRSVTGGASTFQPGIAVLIMFTVVQLITGKVIS